MKIECVLNNFHKVRNYDKKFDFIVMASRSIISGLHSDYDKILKKVGKKGQ